MLRAGDARGSQGAICRPAAEGGSARNFNDSMTPKTLTAKLREDYRSTGRAELCRDQLKGMKGSAWTLEQAEFYLTNILQPKVVCHVRDIQSVVKVIFLKEEP